MTNLSLQTAYVRVLNAELTGRTIFVDFFGCMVVGAAESTQ